MWYSLGKMYSEQGLYDDAIQALEVVTAAAPDSTLTADLLAKAYRKTGQTQKALEIEKRFFR